jgi:16S rRNA (uracil1498-N3)-methyltransferase
MAARFYLSEPIAIGEATLEGLEAHHLAHVRRFGEGDRVTLFNGDGHEYPAEVLSVEKRRVHLRIIGIESPARELGSPLHVAAALPKGDRGDFLIEKLTELGATDLTPLLATRSVVKPRDTKVEKLRAAVVEASKQCGRNVLMRVHPPTEFGEWVRGVKLATKWIAHPGGDQLRMPSHPSEGIAVAVGPEGGFTEDEVAAAVAAGFTIVALGPRVLRVETAAVALSAWLGLSVPG